MTKSAVAYWVGRTNAEIALLTAQQAATTAEHNARYVNGAGTGQLWIDKDAADLAAYNDSQSALVAMTTDRNNQAAALAAEVALYTAALSPAGVNETRMTVNNQYIPSASWAALTLTTAGDGLGIVSNATTLTITRPGHYVAGFMAHMPQFAGTGGDLAIVVNGGIPGRGAGTSHSDVSMADAETGQYLEFDVVGATTVQLQALKYGTAVVDSGELRVIFVPTRAHPS